MMKLPAEALSLIWDDIAITYNGSSDISSIVYYSKGRAMRISTI